LPIQKKEGEQNDEPNSDTSRALVGGGVIPDASDHSPRQTQSLTQLALRNPMVGQDGILRGGW
jgi:hypothetical protein